MSRRCEPPFSAVEAENRDEALLCCPTSGVPSLALGGLYPDQVTSRRISDQHSQPRPLPTPIQGVKTGRF